MRKRIALLFATGFGLGYSPFASGTAGTLPGVAIALAVDSLDWTVQAAIAAALVFAAVPICGAAEKILGRKDDGRIVADEYATFPLSVIGLPLLQAPWLLLLAFVTHRAIDVVKPSPAREAQSIKGGWGIVLDDVIASLYALGINHTVWYLLSLRAES